MMRADFRFTHEQFESKAAQVAPGAGGLLLLPYLEGERTPNVPDGTGVMIGAQPADVPRPQLLPRGDGRRDAGDELRPASPRATRRDRKTKFAQPVAGRDRNSGGRSWRTFQHPRS